MEGFLWKKARGEGGVLSRRNWKKRWFVLEGQYLFYYENFNREAGEPVHRKGVIPVRGCSFQLATHRERQNCFVIKHNGEVRLLAHAEDERSKFVWLEALEKASKGDYGPKEAVPLDEFFETVGLEMRDDVTIKDIQRAYKKKALQLHPDKGGDVASFDKLREAYYMLMSVKEAEQDALLYTTLEYDLVIEKGGRGVGFGLVVVEDPDKRQVTVKSVTSKMICRHIDATAGNVQVGDRLLRIDKDDVANWRLDRVVVRLNDFRVPIGSSVKLRFGRKVKIHQDEEEEKAEDGNDDHFEQQATNHTLLLARAADGYDDDEEEEEEDGGGDRHGHQSDHERNGDNRDDDMQFAQNDHRAGNASNEPNSFAQSHPHPTRGAGGIDSQLRRLEEAEHGREQALQQVQELQEKLLLLEAEKGSLSRQLQEAEAQCNEAERRATHAELQLQQVLVNSAMTQEQTSRVANAAREVGMRIRDDRPLDLSSSAAVAQSMAALNTPSLEELASPDAARTAIEAAAAVDYTGVVLKKWSMQGESGVDKLRRLEARLARVKAAQDPKLSTTPINKPKAKEVLNRRLDADTRPSPRTLERRGIMHDPVAARHNMATAGQTVNQHLKFRPAREDLYEARIMVNRHANVRAR